VNIDVLVEELEKTVPTPIRDSTKPARMYVVRSFDVNKPGTSAEALEGAVIGGTILQGKIKIGDELEICPGIKLEKHGKHHYEPLFTEIVSLHSGRLTLDEAKPGGLVGIGTLLDPSLTKADGLIGNIAGKPETLPPVRSELVLDTHIFERVVGAKEMTKVDKVCVDERLLVDIGTSISAANVVSMKENSARIRLGRPVCVESGSRTAISRRIAGRWRLIGYGIVK
jgi:translation initiation factor 2 subunit 3